MKKLFLLVATGFLFVTSCNKNSSSSHESLVANEPAPSERKCATMEVFEEQLRVDPSLAQRMNDIEAFTRRYAEQHEANRLLANGTMEIPVVVNVLYRSAEENITQQQIDSQIDVLNKDFSGTNTDVNNTSTYGSVKAGDINIKFVLKDVVRKSTTTTSFSTNDAMKKLPNGIPPTDPAANLNIWVCTLSGGVLGYAYYPGVRSDIDGVVILNKAFGTTGTAAAPFDLGRTATHEVGHYFNLIHIWGDRRCGDDKVGDTPSQDAANFGCPQAGIISKCKDREVEMTMNYMDYTDDACMYMFSLGQASRMQATFAEGGPRASLRK